MGVNAGGSPVAVPMLWRERWSACDQGTCRLAFGPDSCQAYGVPCAIEGQPRQEFACHASACRCGSCPLPWPTAEDREVAP